jgi:hypothetical protein
MFNKIFNRINSWMLLTFALFLMPALSLATTADPVFDMQTTYREQIIASLSDVFFSNSLFSWQGGLTKGLFGICVIISMFQIISRYYGSPQFLVEWAKWAVAMMIGLMILGGVSYTGFFPYTPTLSSGQQVPGPATLDKAVFFYCSKQFNALASAVESIGGPDDYAYQMNQLLNTLQEFEHTILYCGATDKSCYQKAFNVIKTSTPGDGVATAKVAPGQVVSTINTSEIADTSTKASLPGTGFGAMISFFVGVSRSLAEFVAQIVPIPFLLIRISVWVLDLVRMFLNYFTLITYALISGIALLFAKLFTVFIVMPDQRGRLFQAYKVPLSATMYGFLTALITALASVIIKAVNAATMTTIMASVGASGMDTSGVIAILFGNSLAICSMLVIQIMAMSKIPGFARQLWNLSFEEIINFGRSVIEAGLGVMKVAAMAGIAGVGAIAGGAAMGVGMAAKGIAGAASGAASSVTSGGSLSSAAGGLLKGTGSSLMSGAKAAGQTTARGLMRSTGYEPGSGLSGFLGGDSGRGGGSGSGGSGSGGGDTGGSGSRSGGGGNELSVKATLDRGSQGGMGILSGGGEKNKSEKFQSSETDGAMVEESQPSPRQNAAARAAEVREESEQNGNNKRSYAGRNSGSQLVSGFQKVGSAVAGLAFAGAGQAFGHEVRGSDHASGKGIANFAFGSADTVIDHSKRGVQAVRAAREAKHTQANQRMTEFHSLASDSIPEQVDADELHSLSQKINENEGTQEDFVNFNQMADGDLSQLPTEIRSSVMAARQNEHMQEWQELRDARLKHFMNSDKLNDYTSKDSKGLHTMFKNREITASDFKNEEKLRDFSKQNRADNINHHLEKIDKASTKFDHVRTNDNLTALKALRDGQKKLKNRADNPNKGPVNYDDTYRKQVLEYQAAMPDLTVAEIASTLGISEIRVREYLASSSQPNIGNETSGNDEDDGPQNPAGV